jgi:colanic acid biosynthesis glycosyl transferase WcaI
MRVLILSQYYFPEPIPKPADLAVALRAAGDDVTVITGLPNYPAGKLYPNYRLSLLKQERIDGIQVLRTFEYPYHGTGAVGRFLNYVSFMLSAPIGSFWAPKVDVIYVWHPPLTIGICAWLIACLRGIPFVYDVQDIWPEAAVLSGMLQPGLIVRCLSWLERFVYRRADHLLVVTEGARDNLISKGVPAEKVSVLPHWYDDSLFTTALSEGREEMRCRLGWKGQSVFLFAGNLGLVQGLDTIVRAAEILRGEPNIRIVFVGDGADRSRLEAVVANEALESRVQFIARQAAERMPAFLDAADGLLVHLKKSAFSNCAIPTKTLAYLASGTPIIMAMQGAAADLVQEAGAGIIVPPEDPAELADAIRRFVALSANAKQEMGDRGRKYLRENLSRTKIVPRYREILRRVVEEG